MKQLVRSRFGRLLAQATMVALVIPLAAPLLAQPEPAPAQPEAAPAQPGQPAAGPPSVGLVAFSSSDPSLAPLADRLTEALRVQLAASGRVKVIGVSMLSPSVQRAIKVESSLSDSDLIPPVNVEKGTRIRQALNLDAVIWGNVTGYSFDKSKGQATVNAELNILETGKELRSVAVTGQSPQKVGYRGKEAGPQSEAVGAAASKMAGEVLGTAPPKPLKAPGQKKHRAGWWPLLILAGVAAGALVMSGGGGKGGPRPPAASTLVINGIGIPHRSSVELNWQLDSSNPNFPRVTGFRISRAEVPPGVTSPNGLDFPPLPASLTQEFTTFTDTAVTPGIQYAYRIQALFGEVVDPNFTAFFNAFDGSFVITPDRPITPTGLRTIRSGADVILNWDPNPEDFMQAPPAGYRLFRSVNGGPFAPLTAGVTVTAPITTFTDVGVPAGALAYKITAISDTFESPQSPPVPVS